MAEGRSDGLGPGPRVEVAEQHDADDGDADGAPQPLCGANGGAGRASVLLGDSG